MLMSTKTDKVCCKLLAFLLVLMFTWGREAIKSIMIDIRLYYFAQAYGSDVYGGNTYQSTGEVQQTEEVGAPSTGFFSSGPEILVPTIIGASVLVAVLVVAIKKLVRRPKEQ